MVVLHSNTCGYFQSCFLLLSHLIFFHLSNSFDCGEAATLISRHQLNEADNCLIENLTEHRLKACDFRDDIGAHKCTEAPQTRSRTTKNVERVRHGGSACTWNCNLPRYNGCPAGALPKSSPPIYYAEGTCHVLAHLSTQQRAISLTGREDTVIC